MACNQERMIAHLSMQNQILKNLTAFCFLDRTLSGRGLVVCFYTFGDLLNWICVIYVLMNGALRFHHFAVEILYYLGWEVLEYLLFGSTQDEWRNSFFETFECLDEILGVLKFF